MLLSPEQRNYFQKNFFKICAEEGFGTNTWTIDLCYLLKRFKINHRMHTTRRAANYTHQNSGPNVTIKDADRIRNRFQNASANGIEVVDGAVSTQELVEHIMTTGPAIVLVDSALLSCDLCKHNKLTSEFRKIFGGPYRGHYVLVVGYTGKLVFHDPARNAPICMTPPYRMHTARSAQGTDYDLMMSKCTTTKDKYSGLVENMSIPATMHQYNGKTYAKFGTAMPIHCATPEEKERLSKTTHHYCDVFSDELLAQLDELAFVRLDENTAEKVFINRHRRLLLTSSDGEVAQWRCAPSFESLNVLVAGAPLVNTDGRLLSLLTARQGKHHAVSNVEGEGGYFETSKPWEIIDMEDGKVYYGDRSFSNREELREYIAGLPEVSVTAETPPRPLLLRGKKPRIILVAENGRQLSHHYLQGNLFADIEYL